MLVVTGLQFLIKWSIIILAGLLLFTAIAQVATAISERMRKKRALAVDANAAINPTPRRLGENNSWKFGRFIVLGLFGMGMIAAGLVFLFQAF